MLWHPKIADLPCSQCKLFIYDDEGNQSTYGGEPIRRPPGTPTPCGTCPKESPERAAELELSPKNWKTLALFLRHRATGFRHLEGADAVLLDNFRALSAIFRQHEEERRERGLTEAMQLAVQMAVAASVRRGI